MRHYLKFIRHRPFPMNVQCLETVSTKVLALLRPGTLILRLPLLGDELLTLRIARCASNGIGETVACSNQMVADLRQVTVESYLTKRLETCGASPRIPEGPFCILDLRFLRVLCSHPNFARHVVQHEALSIASCTTSFVSISIHVSTSLAPAGKPVAVLISSSIAKLSDNVFKASVINRMSSCFLPGFISP